MKEGAFRRESLVLILAGLAVAAINSQAVTVTTESRSNAYPVSGSDLLQTHLSASDYALNVYVAGVMTTLSDGSFGPANSEGTYVIANGSMTYILDTTYVPSGFAITTVNTYSGWNDLGRVNQKYTVSFRQVGSGVFTDEITIDYIATNSQTFVNIADINLTGVDAIRFHFPNQQNAGVGYKEIDVIGPPPAAVYNVTGESNGSGYAVSGSDLLQTALESTDDAIALYLESNYFNGGLPLLTDGLYGPADSKVDSCAIREGTLTYNLDLDAHPAGYNITDINSYSGWQDAGRDNQNYTVSFRKAGSATFGNPISVSHVGTVSDTFVNITDLGLSGVAALRFSFPLQENSGVGYRELDVMGEPPDYFDVTRLDSGSKVITNHAAAVVRIIEGTGVAGDITLEAATNRVSALSQVATGPATIDPEGGLLALDGIYLQAAAGGLTIGAGTLMPAQNVALNLENNSSNNLAINAVIADGRSVACLLNKSGSGTLSLNGTNTYSGVTIFEKGVIDVASFSNYGSGGGLGNRAADYPRNVGLLFHGGTLRYSGSTAQRTDRAIRINADMGDGRANAVIDASGSHPDATLTFTSSASPDFFENPGRRSLTLTGTNPGNNSFGMAIREIGGTTSLIKSGPGTWVLAGANSYSGGTRIEGGTLKSNATGSGAVSVAAGATWDAGVTGQSVAGLSGSGNVVRAWGMVSTGADGAALISTEKSYIHLLDFGNGSGASVNGVNFNSAGTSGADWLLSGSATLYTEAAGTSNYTQLVSDFYYGGHPGVLTFSNLTLGQLYNIVLYTKVDWWKGRLQNAIFSNGSNTHQLFSTEPGNVGYYSYRFVAGASTATITMIPNNAKADTFHWFAATLESEGPVALTVGDGNDYLFAGVISGPTALVKQGSGRLTLAGASTYSGSTTVSAGTLEITAGNVLPASTSVALISGSVMMLNYTGEQIVAALSFDGVPQYKGSWGGSGSSADHDSVLFSGPGILRVLTGPAAPGTLIFIR